MLRVPTLCVSIAAGLLVTGAAAAQTAHIESPAERVTLLELYTSEGCSSCPPADRWLSRIEADPGLWRRVVPVAFHVDYWDYIGWKDRFASPRFAERQREYARQRHVSGVYTPGFVVHGEEWRGWFTRPVLDLDHPPPAGRLTLTLGAGRRVDARFTAAAAIDGALELHVAVLGFGLRTRVEDGENDGRTLEHDFVVLAYARAPMDGSSPRFSATARLPEASADSPRTALAGWVSARGDPRPLQAAGGWIER